MTLGRRGATVMLTEAGEPGGRVTLESRLPGLSEWARVRDWHLHQLSKLLNVQIFPGSRMTAQDVIDTDATHVMIATGSLWRHNGLGRSHPAGIPSFDDPRTVTPDQILSGTRPLGDVVIFDDEGYHIAAGLADLLAGEGREVTYVTPAGTVSDWSLYTVEQALFQARPIERGLKIVTSHSVAGLSDGTARLRCVYTALHHDIPCDVFVPVTSREPQDAPWQELQEKGLQTLVRIGDAQAPGFITNAVHDGHRFARGHLSPVETFRRERVIASL